ncbi:MAG TPA: RNA polymerase sigma factor [Planctomycetota bacterium]|jgi:RNA polymerase sigma-70 factor (ECF subfamily)
MSGISGPHPRPTGLPALRDASRSSDSPVEKSAEKQELDQRIVALVRRFRDGEEAAFDELAPLAGRMAYHLALRSVADANTAEEISQEALVRLYKHVGEIAGEGAFKTWFYRIVLNLVHDHYRRAIRKDSATTTLEEIRTVEAKSHDEPLTNLEREGLRDALTEALACLDEKHREAFLMKEVEGMSHAEIAKTLDVPEGTVWSRLSYARRKLQEKLRRLGYSA